jgi:hypothetical protein
MNIYQLPQRMEIVFWTTAISMMNNSPHVRYMVRKAYPIMKNMKRTPFLLLTLAWGAIGLVLGFGLSLWVFYPR